MIATFKQAPLAEILDYADFCQRITTDWELDSRYVKLLRRYFLRKWHTANLLALMRDDCLLFEGFNYQIRFIGGKAAVANSTICSLSFRLPYGSIFPTVLVKTTPINSY